MTVRIQRTHGHGQRRPCTSGYGGSWCPAALKLTNHTGSCHYGDIDPKCNGCKSLLAQMTPEEIIEFNRVEEI